MITFINKTERSEELLSQLEEITPAEAAFPVTHKELHYYSDSMLPSPSGYKALMNADTNSILYVGKEYSPIHNREILDVMSQLEEFGWAQTVIRSYQGRQFRFEMKNPSLKFSVNNFEAVAKLSVVNSYDGSQALKIFVGGIIAVCSNGLTIGKGIEYKRKHTGLDSGMGAFSQQLHSAATDTIAKAMRNVEQKVWTENNLEQLQTIWKNLTKEFPPRSNGQPNDFVKALDSQFKVEQAKGYTGEFGMMMAATDIVTHQYRNHPASYILQLEKNIPKVFFPN